MLSAVRVGEWGTVCMHGMGPAIKRRDGSLPNIRVHTQAQTKTMRRSKSRCLPSVAPRCHRHPSVTAAGERGGRVGLKAGKSCAARKAFSPAHRPPCAVLCAGARVRVLTCQRSPVQNAVIVRRHRPPWRSEPPQPLGRRGIVKRDAVVRSPLRRCSGGGVSRARCRRLRQRLLGTKPRLGRAAAERWRRPRSARLPRRRGGRRQIAGPALAPLGRRARCRRRGGEAAGRGRPLVFFALVCRARRPRRPCALGGPRHRARGPAGAGPRGMRARAEPLGPIFERGARRLAPLEGVGAPHALPHAPAYANQQLPPPAHSRGPVPQTHPIFDHPIFDCC